MKKNIFIITFITLTTVCFLCAEKIYTKNIECHKGYVKKYDWYCENPITSLAYSTNNYKFYLNDIWCGNDCNFDGTNCKKGLCDKNEITRLGYTEIKDKKFYNPKTHLAYEGDNFYLNNIPCGFGCNFDGTNCKLGLCDKKEIIRQGYNEIRDEKFYNPKINLSFRGLHGGTGDYIDFYLNNVQCGYDCNFDGTNCKSGFCDKYEINNKGFIEKDEGFYNSKSNLYFHFNTIGYYNYFSLNGVSCGTDCDFDGKNCKRGFCDINELTNNGFTEIKNMRFYNPKKNLSFDYMAAFYIDAYKDEVQCGYKCDLGGKNCERGNCDFNAIKKHGYTLSKAHYEKTGYSVSHVFYRPEKFHNYSCNKFYNPNTHISFQNGEFYFENIPCGYNCDLDGRNCEEGVCDVADCANEYKKLGILTTTSWTSYMSPIPYMRDTDYFICYNNSKYYNVFEPNIIKNTIFKNIKHVDK